MSLVIDAHHHFWQLGRFGYEWLNAPQLSRIKRDFLPEHLKPLIDATGVQHTIFVQTQHNVEETKWVLGLADQHDFIAGVVGWVDLASDDCERQLLELKQHPKFVGVRHVTHDEADDNFIVRSDVLRGLRVLEQHRVPFDLLFFPKHLRHVPAIVTACPNLRLVIDHLAKPAIKSQQMSGWVEEFRIAATYPNVFCKLSGMVTEADWTNWKPTDLRPYIDVAIDAFGPERLMFGTDWPVCELAAPYEQVHAALAEAIASLSPAARACIWGQTAARFYNLRVER